MSVLFIGIALTMSLLAVAIVARPLALTSGRNHKGNVQLPLLILVAAIVIAVGLYIAIGRPSATTPSTSKPAWPQSGENPHETQERPGTVASVSSMTDRLAERLQNEPDDAGGWLLLARSYHHLDRQDDARAAYERAQALRKTDADLEQSLLGTSGAARDIAVEQIAALRGRVQLSPEMASQVEPDDTVFIFAKESRDHRMPVVALRKRAADLPLEFALTDDDAMMPGARLADFENLVVTARVSRSGMATDTIPGLEVWSKPVSPMTGQVIELLITGESATDTNAEGRQR